MRIPYSDMVSVFSRILESRGMAADDAALAARLFSDASADGVHSHGLNRFPRFVSNIESGIIDVHSRATLESRIGGIERWNGNRGPGNINAWICTERACDIAAENAIGVVALRNTNHWLRPGNYGIEAVRRGCIAIMWTNTMPNMPPWGAKKAAIGNNPIVLAVPYGDSPLIVDVAMSMFSYGKLEKYSMDGTECPVDGGFDEDGNPTRDPEAILKTRQVLPIGYWKGSGLSIALDLIVSCISGGLTTKEVGALDSETSLSQIFIAISMDSFPDRKELVAKIEATLEAIEASEPMKAGMNVHYPGEGMKHTRDQSMRLGVYADDAVWSKVLGML